MFENFECVLEGMINDKNMIWQEYFQCENSASVFSMADQHMARLEAIDRCLLWAICGSKFSHKVFDSLIAGEFGSYIFQVDEFYPVPKLSNSFLVLESEGCLSIVEALSYVTANLNQSSAEVQEMSPTKEFISSIPHLSHVSCYGGGSSSQYLQQSTLRKISNSPYAVLILNVDQVKVGHSRSILNTFVSTGCSQRLANELEAAERRREKRLSQIETVETKAPLEGKPGLKPPLFATFDCDIVPHENQKSVPTQLLINARRIFVRTTNNKLFSNPGSEDSWPNNLAQMLSNRTIFHGVNPPSS